MKKVRVRIDLVMGAKEAAAFIHGYLAARRQRTPKWLRPHVKTAAQIFNGGAFNPISVALMVLAAQRLWQDAQKVGGR